MNSDNSPSDLEIETPKLKKFGLFGYEIGGWGSVLAFLLATFGLILQVYGYVVGPDARILPLRGVEFTCSHQDGEMCEADSNFILIAVGFEVANYGKEGYDTSVDPAHAVVSFLSDTGAVLRDVTLSAQFFTKRTQIEIQQEPISKIYLKAGSSVDFEVAYYPRMIVSEDGSINRSNFLKFSEFKNILKKGIGEKRVKSILITLHPKATGRNRYDMKQSCKVIVDEKMRISAGDLEVGTFPRDCFNI